MTKAVAFFEIFVTYYQTTRLHIQEDSNVHNHRRENLKCHVVCLLHYLTTVSQIHVTHQEPL
jgi:hypothetical protein